MAVAWKRERAWEKGDSGELRLEEVRARKWVRRGGGGRGGWGMVM